MRIPVPANAVTRAHDFGTLLFDIDTDPKQMNPLQDREIEACMAQHLVRLLEQSDAPPEQFERLGLPPHALR